MTIFVFDTETTGLPTKNTGFQFCRLVEIGYKIFSDEGEEIKNFQAVIHPDNFVISNSHIHGICMDFAVREGMHIKDLFDILREDLRDVSLIVGHNVIFDISVLLNEFKIYGQRDLIDKVMSTECKCTMYIAQLKYKLECFPRLIDLYKRETGQELQNAHTAMADCSATADCYFSLIKK